MGEIVTIIPKAWWRCARCGTYNGEHRDCCLWCGKTWSHAKEAPSDR